MNWFVQFVEADVDQLVAQSFRLCNTLSFTISQSLLKLMSIK